MLLNDSIASTPISLSGTGLREGGYLYFRTKLGIDQPSAVAYGSLWFLAIVANSVIGGLVFVANGARVPTLRDAEAGRAPAPRAPLFESRPARSHER